MSIRAKFFSGVVLTVLVVTTWIYMSRPTKEVAFAVTQQPLFDSAARIEPTTKPPVTLDVPGPHPPLQEEPQQSKSTESQPTERRDAPASLTERTLVGTKWEREGFGLEFGAAGKLLIGGRERANWSVEGQRVRLYRDTTGEEHWLDIVGNKLMWGGQEIGRVR